MPCCTCLVYILSSSYIHPSSTGNHQSHPSARTPASVSKCFLSTSSNPFSSVQSMSMIATVYTCSKLAHYPLNPRTFLKKKRKKKNSLHHQPKSAQQSHSDSPHHTQYVPGTPSHRQQSQSPFSRLRFRTRRAQSGLVDRLAFPEMGRVIALGLRMCRLGRGTGIYRRGYRILPSLCSMGGRRRCARGGRRCSRDYYRLVSIPVLSSDRDAPGRSAHT